ncbi:hypothetical protein BJV78DRAFT_563424 [Lactifluus subvellereus]|nr:hypothetical protein BJV78DRAFT_563424 [Lactifluus subvellereus]
MGWTFWSFSARGCCAMSGREGIFVWLHAGMGCARISNLVVITVLIADRAVERLFLRLDDVSNGDRKINCSIRVRCPRKYSTKVYPVTVRRCSSVFANNWDTEEEKYGLSVVKSRMALLVMVVKGPAARARATL